MFKLELLPAHHGDAIWITYGPEDAPHHILIDGGTTGAFKHTSARLAALPEDQRRLELMTVTHIDADHISGMLKLLEEGPDGVTFRDVWFNGYRHLSTSGLMDFGPVQGEKLTSLIMGKELPWNRDFNGDSVVVMPNDDLPVVELPGDMKLTLLSPGPKQLGMLKPKWEEECKKAGLDPSTARAEPEEAADPPVSFGATVDVEALAAARFPEDTSLPNGASIAFLAQHDGRSVLLSGDGHGDVIGASIERLTGGEPLNLDAFKMPHHGSRANCTVDLLKKVNCKRYLFSSNGAYFKHPDKEGVARAVIHGGEAPSLYFNYMTQYNKMWSSKALQDKHGYTATYPGDGEEGIALDL